MLELAKTDTIGCVLNRALDRYADASMLAVPANAARDYWPEGLELSYRNAIATIFRLSAQYKSAGFGVGHIVALNLENRPEHLLHKLALNVIGTCCVPISPDHRVQEIAYVLDHAKPDLVVTLGSRCHLVQEATSACITPLQIVEVEKFDAHLPSPAERALSTKASGDTPASILYTSGTTGKPKGCVLSHRYELAAGAWYAQQGHLTAMRPQTERLYNPLPLCHVNASILSFWCMALTGGCYIQSDRFHPKRWWTEIRETRASVVHYLGVIIPMLMSQAPSADDQNHNVRFAVGAGVEPQLHYLFEERFGFPLIEIWGMTEIVRLFMDNTASRQIGTRAFGKPVLGLEARIADEHGKALNAGTSGELLVRHSEASPREDFFSGYLHDPVATEAAWAGGWFHTGDMVVQGEDGTLHFVDRIKNIIRRSGENIAAAEVEAALLTHPSIAEAAVMAVKDDVREEEVFACIVLKPHAEQALADAERLLAQDICQFCMQHMAYYKAPGWVCFRDEIPKTGTQKIQKHQLFAVGQDPLSGARTYDLRSFKKRT